MKKMSVTALPALALVAALVGCGGGTGDSATEPAATTPDVPAPARSAVDDLVAELGVDPVDVESVEVEEVTWNDGSLGCATDGEMYTQATVEGHRITLEVDGETYEYHDGRGREAFLCERPTE